MKTKINNKEYEIIFPALVPVNSKNTFQALAKKVIAFEETFHPAEAKPFTVSCIIRTMDDTNRIVEAKAFTTCSEKDTYCKVIGEKIALGRALAQLNLTKTQRKAVWRDYFVSSAPRRRFHKNLVLEDQDVQLQTQNV